MTIVLDYFFFNAHWLFISYYLQVACLFRLTFMYHDESVLAKMKQRRKLLTVVNVAFQLALLLYVSAAILVDIYDTEHLTADIESGNNAFEVLLSVFFATVLTLAMNHIQKCQKELQSSGIRPNTLVMRLYAACWVVNALLEAILAAIDTSLRVKDTDSVSSSVSWCFTLAGSAVFICQSCLETLIFWTYLKFSSRLEERLVTEAIGTLQSTMGSAET